MGITPIEMYTMVPKSQEASTLKQSDHAHTQNNQANIVSHINSEIKHNSQQTVKSDESRKEEYRYDAKDGGSGKYSGRDGSKKREKKEETRGISNMAGPGGFDVRI